MGTLRLCLVAATAALVLVSLAMQDEMAPTKESPPSSIPTPSSPPSSDIMAPLGTKKHPDNWVKYSGKIHAKFPLLALMDSFMNTDIPAETWLKEVVQRMQEGKEQSLSIIYYRDKKDEDKQTMDNFKQDVIIESVGALEFEPDFNAPGPLYPDALEEKNVVDGGQEVENSKSYPMYEFGDYDAKIEYRTSIGKAIEPPRSIRQNPNLGRTKTLVAEDLEKLRTANSHDTESRKPQLFVYNSTSSTENSLFEFFKLAAICFGVVVVLFGLIFGLYKISLKVKAAADVDYPAYGVTGPTIDTSADKKLAQSAQMYHYQHQKQQIIALEKIGGETRNGSVSDLDSEDDNEEGDYTVYECPGFATTGNMEVKNPMFMEETAMVTPGKCAVVRPQPQV